MSVFLRHLRKTRTTPLRIRSCSTRDTSSRTPFRFSASEANVRSPIIASVVTSAEHWERWVRLRPRRRDGGVARPGAFAFTLARRRALIREVKRVNARLLDFYHPRLSHASPDAHVVPATPRLIDPAHRFDARS